MWPRKTWPRIGDKRELEEQKPVRSPQGQHQNFNFVNGLCQITCSMQWGACAVVFAVACGVYLSTLKAGFTFDDNFAVVRILH